MSTGLENTRAAVNLVHNDGFTERGGDGLPTGWEIVRPEGMPPVMEVAVDREMALAGGAAVRIHGTAGDTGIVRLRQGLPQVRPGGCYRLSACIRHDGIAEPRRSIGL